MTIRIGNGEENRKGIATVFVEFVVVAADFFDFGTGLSGAFYNYEFDHLMQRGAQ